MNKIKVAFFIISICTLLTACKNEIKFEKSGWATKEDLGIYPNRNKMLKNLTHNHKLKGLSYYQLINIIGEPEENIVGNSNTIYYNIVTDYGFDIDPVYIKTLEFKLDKDTRIQTG